MGWLTFDSDNKSQLLSDGVSSARWVVTRENAFVWEKKIKAAAKREGMDIEMWSLESDGWVYFLATEGGDYITPALEVEGMAKILRKRNLKPEGDRATKTGS